MLNKLANLLDNLNTNVANMNISGMPRAFLIIFSSTFLSFGLLYLVGLIFEFCKSGSLNYDAVVKFVGVYFGTAVVATFIILGKALVDKNKNGIPDNWEDKGDEK